QGARCSLGTGRAWLYVDQGRSGPSDVGGLALAYRGFDGSCGGFVFRSAHGRHRRGGQLRWVPGLSFNIKPDHPKLAPRLGPEARRWWWTYEKPVRFASRAVDWRQPSDAKRDD